MATKGESGRGELAVEDGRRSVQEVEDAEVAEEDLDEERRHGDTLARLVVLSGPGGPVGPNVRDAHPVVGLVDDRVVDGVRGILEHLFAPEQRPHPQVDGGPAGKPGREEAAFAHEGVARAQPAEEFIRVRDVAQAPLRNPSHSACGLDDGGARGGWREGTQREGRPRLRSCSGSGRVMVL